MGQDRRPSQSVGGAEEVPAVPAPNTNRKVVFMLRVLTAAHRAAANSRHSENRAIRMTCANSVNNWGPWE